MRIYGKNTFICFPKKTDKVCPPPLPDPTPPLSETLFSRPDEALPPSSSVITSEESSNGSRFDDNMLLLVWVLMLSFLLISKPFEEEDAGTDDDDDDHEGTAPTGLLSEFCWY